MDTSRRILVVICVSLLFLSVFVVHWEVKTTAAVSTTQNPPAATTAPKEKTIGESQKNIKVLNDFPESQLIPMMNLMSASLGVRCNFCHVQKNGQWDFAIDDKPEKNTAREMITMTLNINKSTFRGGTEVSCFTCHQGRTRPTSVLPLPIVEPTPRSSSGPPATGPIPAQPTADEILNKYTAAVGGQGAIDKLKTRVMKGTYVLGNGTTGNYEVTQAAPDRFYILRTSPQGNSEQAFNGTEGWSKDARGVSDIRADQLADLRSDYQFFRDLKLKDQFTRMNVRRDKLDGRDVYVMTGLRPDKRRERLYFDADSGLLVRRMSFTETPIGLLPDQIDYEDYRDVDGLKVPFTVKVNVVGGFNTATRKFSEIRLNVPVDDSRFARPAATTPAKP